MSTTFTVPVFRDVNGVRSPDELTLVSNNGAIVETIVPAEVVLPQGNVLVGNASGVGVALEAKGNGQILVGNGTTITSVAMSVDATMANTGVVTIGADVVTFAKMSVAARAWFNAIRDYLNNGLLVHGALAIDAVPEKFQTTATAVYTLNGVTYTKAATVELTFTAAHVITASKFGVVLVQINAAGTVSTKVPLATQAYNDAPTALAALPSADAGNTALGYIAIENNAGDWTANTDDLTNASDVTTAAFNNTVVKSLPVAV